MKVRDSQRQRCYDWENKHLGVYHKPLLSQEETISFIKQIYRDVWIECPKVEFIPQRRGACSSWGGRTLSFGPRATTREIICHEAAHSICSRRFLKRRNKQSDIESHGPEFVATYVELLVKYCGYDKQALHESMIPFKLKAWQKGQAFDQRVP